MSVDITQNGQEYPIETITTDTNLDDTHYTVLIDTGLGNVTATLPDATTCLGRIYYIKWITAANTAKYDSAGGNIDGTAAAAGITLAAQYDCERVQSDGTQWWRLATE